MIGEEKEVLEIDCQGCNNAAAPGLSHACDKCLADKEFDIVRLKTKLFTKEYDSNRRLLSVEPFFVDVRFRNITEGFSLVEEYFLKTGAKVQIFQKQGSVGYIYFISLPEMNLSFSDLKKLYKDVETFKKTGKTDELYVKRWYSEYGILEHLLFDDQVLEININPPAYKTTVRIVHAKYEECISNIYPSDDFLNYLSTRLKMQTGRPLNKAQPQLDGEIKIEDQRARVAAIIDPFSLLGTAYSIRKHREDPWTLPLFMENKTLNSWFAGLMSLAIAHGRSFLTAGPRGSGKTSLLSSLILEILPKYRIITIEDTEELPVASYKKLGYDILPLKVRSALLKEGMEMPFDMGVRTSLRLGDSSLILGEIRSTEATVLYEAMRVGAMSNVVASTIHADNPYGVYDRVVNDLGVPKGSFKVTDLIIIQNLIKTPTGLSRKRRVTQVTEVLKDWEQEPKFQDLLVYNPKTDELEPTDFLINGKSVLLNTLLKNTKGYKSYGDVLEDLRLRGWAKEVHVRLAGKNKALLEAKYLAEANTLFTVLFEKLQPIENPGSKDEFKEQFMQDLDNYFKSQTQQSKKP
jgi:type IV secretory pathway ATPase VirB11/archaellum biosynthesis ATPase